MWLPVLAVVAGLAVLVWSADKFIDGAAAVARHFALPPLLIGVVIVGFGTSAPEMAVSVLSAMEGNAGIALGNAYGSNIANIALILGITAVISPVVVRSQILRQELPILTGITALSVLLVWDLRIDSSDAWLLLAVFAGLLAWSIRASLGGKDDALGTETKAELDAHPLPIAKAWFWLAAGLVLLVASSRLLVWGAVTIAQSLGVSDLVIGLTVVAVGTSLPEMASCIAAARKNEHDLAMGNVLGSNLFNSLAVVGLAGVIHPLEMEPAILTRDMAMMAGLTVALFALGYGHGGRLGRINRWEGGFLVASFVGYTSYLLYSTLWV